MNHDAITNIITRNRTIEYGVGITPNPFESQQKEWVRRHQTAALRKLITDKIVALFEPRFITPPETAECLEALITMTDSRRILELGMCTGFGTLHMLRAIIGKPGAKVTSVDSRPAHDRAFFTQPSIAEHFEFIEGWTPDAINKLRVPVPFDFVFVDSDHSVDHCEVELDALFNVTMTGSIITFHDCPEQQSPQVPQSQKAVIWTWLHQQVARGKLRGTCLPSCEQLDCLDAWGVGYPRQCNPGLGIFVRN